MRPSLDDTIKELEYELGKKKEVFPTWIKIGKITKKKADHRIACTNEAIRRLRELQAKGEQKSLF